MRVEDFVEIINSKFYTGVPDSLLHGLIDYLGLKFGFNSKQHIICANEGNALATGAGYYLATGEFPVVYLQNSGLGNLMNPVASLLNENIYSIPALLIIGLRGEEGVKDEPQHIFQGKITAKTLDLLEIEHFTISNETEAEELKEVFKKFKILLKEGKQAAFIIKKGALEYESGVEYKNNHTILRKEALKHILKFSETSPVVSTTGKISREIFELREEEGQEHKFDFLTVGSMGHCSSIALGIAITREEKIWCIDGDGALLMHLGAMPVIANSGVKNFVHILLNNEAHESVGGMPTAGAKTDFVSIARASGYDYAVCVQNLNDLDIELEKIKNSEKLCFIEVKCSLESNKNLMRPSKTPKENKENFMRHISKRQ